MLQYDGIYTCVYIYVIIYIDIYTFSVGAHVFLIPSSCTVSKKRVQTKMVIPNSHF